jgi:4-alpha-glucanotransferase
MARHDEWGVADGWWATDGSWREADPATRDRLHRAQGAEAHPDGVPSDPPMWFVHPGETHPLWSPATIVLEDATVLTAGEQLPAELPLGVHSLVPDDGGPTTTLFVVPERAPRPSRGWGWSTQLYGTRSADSWGHGDLEDLAELARWTANAGGSLLAHNPLGAPLPLEHVPVSPYFASSRRFWSPLYLRVESVAGADRLGDELSAAATAGHELNRRALLDHDRVWALKRTALEQIWQLERTGSSPTPPPAHDADPELTLYATFCALCEHHGTGWLDWPAELRHPDAPAVRAFAARHPERVAFHRWLQEQLDVQLAAAARAGAGLMADLPVGFDPSGFDAWVDQDLLAPGCSVGAPPDEFSPTGQDWGLAPYVPWRLRAAGYAPWITTLRRVLRHASALRIDHVMGLFRLFWIPGDADARHGGYVHHRGSDLLDLAVMEAARAGATLVGEDLGTVEAEVRTALSDRDVFGYRIGWFADDPPADWPRTTLASLTTHDLPTVAGLWSGQDARDRAAAGVAADPDGDAVLRARLERLARLGGADAELALDGSSEDERLRALVLAAHDALAHSGSDLAVATLEDAIGVRSRPNLPGTVDEHPNWRQALPVSIEDLDAAGAAEIADVMGRAGRR